MLGALQAEESHRSTINKISHSDWLLFRGSPLGDSSIKTEHKKSNIDSTHNTLPPNIESTYNKLEIFLKQESSDPNKNDIVYNTAANKKVDLKCQSSIKTGFAVSNYHLIKQPTKIESSLDEIKFKKSWLI
ncbi:unnamed protein product [Gordionus sp. m RMFG-2023]